jgi:hypothetical protein
VEPDDAMEVEACGTGVRDEEFSKACSPVLAIFCKRRVSSWGWIWLRIVDLLASLSIFSAVSSQMVSLNLAVSEARFNV